MEAKKNLRADLDQFRPLFFTIGLVTSLTMVTMAFEWKSYDKPKSIALYEADNQYEEVLDIPITQQAPPPAPKMILPEIVEVPDEVEVIQDLEIVLDIEIHEETIIQEADFELMPEAPKEETADEIFLVVEERPEPKGGFGTFYEYIAQNLLYPTAAVRSEIQGKVFVQFVVDKDGSLTDFEVIKGIGFGCDQEAVRVMKDAPVWVPGKQRGVPVRVRMVMPISFKIK